MYFEGLQDESPLYDVQARYYVECLTTLIGVRTQDVVLDFGAGFGLVAARLARVAGELWWWEPSPNMRAVADRNIAAFQHAYFWDPAVCGHRRFDLILVNSVVQYMPPEELRSWLPRWRQLLAPGGRLVLSDLIAPGHSSVSDAADLVRFGITHGAPIAALSDVLGGVTRYWRTRRAVPLTEVGRDALAYDAAEAQLSLDVLPRNLTHLRKRWTAVLAAR